MSVCAVCGKSIGWNDSKAKYGQGVAHFKCIQDAPPPPPVDASGSELPLHRDLGSPISLHRVRGVFGDSGAHIVTYERGFTHIRRGHTDTYLWSDIERVRYGEVRQIVNFIPVGTERSLTIITRNDAELAFSNSLSDVADLAETVQTNVFPFLFAQAERAIDAGGKVYFGPISVSRRGIEARGKYAGWKDVAGMTVISGEVFVNVWKAGHPKPKARTFARFPISATDNFRVLLAIFEHMGKLLRP